MGRPGVTVVLCLSGLLVLAACSAGPSGSPAAQGTRAAASATAAPATASSAGSARIGPFTQEFSTPLPASPAQATVITDFREAQILWVKSLVGWQLAAPVTGYVTGDALNHLVTAISANRSHHLVPSGTDRMFMTQVTGISGGTATVTTCDDSSKYQEQDPATGQVNPAYTPSRDQAYLFETWLLVQLSGHWAISSFSIASMPDQAAQPCQP
jgi:hypothetical protein